MNVLLRCYGYLCVKKMTITWSPLIGHLFDVIVIASTEKRKSTEEMLNSWKVLEQHGKCRLFVSILHDRSTTTTMLIILLRWPVLCMSYNIPKSWDIFCLVHLPLHAAALFIVKVILACSVFRDSLKTRLRLGLFNYGHKMDSRSWRRPKTSKSCRG